MIPLYGYVNFCERFMVRERDEGMNYTIRIKPWVTPKEQVRAHVKEILRIDATGGVEQ